MQLSETEIEQRIQTIHKKTDIKVKSFKITAVGCDSLVFDVNNEWIIRFYRNDVAKRNMVKRIPFLKNFSKVSPLEIPCPEIHNDEFMAYKTIHGEHLSIHEIEQLDTLSRGKIAEQLGNFKPQFLSAVGISFLVTLLFVSVFIYRT